MRENVKSKAYYVFVGCMSLALMIMGATFAYFSASASDENTIVGNAATVTFSLSVSRATTVDMAYGLIPMYDDRAPYAAYSGCRDDLGNPVCQVYKIIIKADSPTVMFLDGYIVMNPKEGVDVSFTEVKILEDSTIEEETTADEENTETIESVEVPIRFKTLDDFDASTMVGTGIRGSLPNETLNHNDDANCLFIVNDKIGGENEEDLVNTYYVMVWLHDTGTNQNAIQGMELAYTGDVTFLTAEGNEISASFD